MISFKRMVTCWNEKAWNIICWSAWFYPGFLQHHPPRSAAGHTLHWKIASRSGKNQNFLCVNLQCWGQSTETAPWFLHFTFTRLHFPSSSSKKIPDSQHEKNTQWGPMVLKIQTTHGILGIPNVFPIMNFGNPILQLWMVFFSLFLSCLHLDQLSSRAENAMVFDVCPSFLKWCGQRRLAPEHCARNRINSLNSTLW